MIEQSPYRGYKSTVETTLHFGLGNTRQIDTLLVTWPDGRISLLKQLPVNQTVKVKQEQAAANLLPESNTFPAFFEQVSPMEKGLQYVHHENSYIDFKQEFLLPHRYSQNGPGMAVGDIDGNGLEDVFIGAASGAAGQFFLQIDPGRFHHQPLVTPSKPKWGDDMGTLLFDADNDQDLDLYVVIGGNEWPANDTRYRDHLYLNDGKGNFTEDTLALPDTRSSGSCVVAADFDRDGDLDLFIGGRNVPRKYPLPARSYLLQNDKGKFTDLTDSLAPGLAQIGMVTSALWTDFDNDNQVDLLVAGEWMPLTFYKNTDGKLLRWDAGTGKISPQINHSVTPSPNHLITQSYGWWNSLAGGDFDNDGDIDCVAGNWGLNSQFRASATEPVQVFAKDYDRNGTLDPIMCHYIQGKPYPSAPRDQLADQIPPLKRQFTSYAAYGQLTMPQLISAERQKEAYIAKATWFPSSYIENLGNGRFTIRALPTLAQTAPVFGMLTDDVDGDGNLDILLTGNSYASDVLVGRYDAFAGQLLKGDGKGNFTVVSHEKSGFMADKDAKSMVELASGGNETLTLVASNNDTLQVFRSQKQYNGFIYPLHQTDFSAFISLPNGQKRKLEFYNGSGYLSQSSKVLKVPAAQIPFTVTDYRGRIRKLTKPL